jgi:signal transduction histidine kinase
MIAVHHTLCFFWFVLFTLGLLFLALEARCRFDKAFLYHGSAILLLNVFTAVDLWILPVIPVDESLVYVRIQHLTFLFFACFTLVNVLSIIGQRRSTLVRAVFLISMIISVFTFSDLVLKIENHEIVTGILYVPLFGSFLPFMLSALIYLIVTGVNRVPKAEQRILRTHLIGLSILGGCGVLDMFTTVFPSLIFISSATLVGTVLYGLTVSSIFVDRFLQVLQDRSSVFKKLELAYRELESANTLKEIGEATAIVNHEIKNYMFMISGNAQLLKEMEPLTLKGQEMVGNIITSVERMTQFSKDVLDMSREKISFEKYPINLVSLLVDVVGRHFKNQAAGIVIESSEDEQIIQGDWGRLEQVFINLIKNAIEATPSHELPKIHIRIRATEAMILASIEDNGVGCSQEQMNNFFKAFVTTKRSRGGTGLGLSIVKNIIECHGGKISAYSKNLIPGNGHGTRLMLSFPNLTFKTKEIHESLVKVVLVMGQDFMGLNSLIQLLKNICITPIILESTIQLHALRNQSLKTLVLTTPGLITQNSAVFREFMNIGMVSQNGGSLFVLDYGQGRNPEALSEEYVFQRLIEIGKSRALRGLGERAVSVSG